MKSCAKYCCIIFLSLEICHSRDLWSEDLPQDVNVILEKGKPIRLEKNLTQVRIRELNGTLYSDSLSQLDSLTTLRIYRNQLREIERGALCPSHNLKILELEFYGNKNPPTLSKNTFDGCSGLEELILKFDMGADAIPSSIDNDAFENLLNLKNISIQGYRLNHIEKDLFRINPASLNSLTLSFTHSEKIDWNVFENFKNLKEVSIIHNSGITSLPENLFSNLPKLEKITLTDLNLKNLTWNEFKNLPSLNTLDLMDNQISYYDALKIASNMPSLKELEVGLNPGSCETKKEFARELKAKLNHDVNVSYDCFL